MTNAYINKVDENFIKIESITSINRNSLRINFSFQKSPFGKILIASSTIGICFLSFYSDDKKAVEQLKLKYPNAILKLQSDAFQQNALLIFRNEMHKMKPLKLHITGTEFQLRVWNELLKISKGTKTTYKNIAKNIGAENAVRAVGTAIGRNPVAVLIPCHRVIQSSGGIGGYMWGIGRKSEILTWELL